MDTTKAAAAAAAACLAAPLLDKLSNVATADVFSIRAALFIEYACRYAGDACCKCGRCAGLETSLWFAPAEEKVVDRVICLSVGKIVVDTAPTEPGVYSSFLALFEGLDTSDLG